MSRKKLLQPSPSCILLTDVTSSRNQFKHENKSRIFQLEMDTWEVFDLNHISDARCSMHLLTSNPIGTRNTDRDTL